MPRIRREWHRLGPRQQEERNLKDWLLERKPKPTDADIDEAMTNICRCGTYDRIRRAIHRAAAELRGGMPA